MILRKEYKFESAHFIYNHASKCRGLHGHSYRLFVSVKGPVNPETGMVMDFYDLSKIVCQNIINKLDHCFLNDLIPLSTAENIIVWIWDHLKSELPSLYQLELFETTDNCVIYQGS